MSQFHRKINKRLSFPFFSIVLEKHDILIPIFLYPDIFFPSGPWA